MINYGLRGSSQQPQDYLFGTAEKKLLNPLGDWSMYLPDEEIQKKREGEDTSACVTFSALNCLETLGNFHRQFINCADKFTANMSGTIRGWGNYLRSVAESIRRDGVVDEVDYPFKEPYYEQVPQEVLQKAYKLPVVYEWLKRSEDREKQNKYLKEALQYAPIQVTVNAWGKPDKNGVYQQRKNKDNNHAVMLYKIDKDGYYHIFDSYAPYRKKLAPDYNIGSPLQYYVGEFKVNLAKKFKNKLFMNKEKSNKVFYSNGEQIAWIKNMKSLDFLADYWGKGEDIIQTSHHPIKHDLIF